MEKLLRRLRRELTRNPKQSAVLGIGLLVAAYFWAPLAAGWLPGASKPKASNVAEKSPTTAAAGAAPAPDFVPPSGFPRWQ
ncbi:MAG: hypothetical protein KY475_16450, partial [Planctomycetes bacterium]|nr:hypothetical protein [Planctomycetota bacterium]